MRAAAVFLVLSALALAGCGSAPAPPPGPTVRLQLTAPANGERTSADTVVVRGRVSPATAKVLVLGQRTAIRPDGTFAARIHLADGSNLIDVIASAPRSSGAVAALALVRFLLVTVPSVDGESPSSAITALSALGLDSHVQGSRDPFNFILPFSTHVCSTSPEAGSRVDPGSTVTLYTAKVCL